MIVLFCLLGVGCIGIHIKISVGDNRKEMRSGFTSVFSCRLDILHGVLAKDYDLPLVDLTNVSSRSLFYRHNITPEEVDV